jgi:hypothetical protein
MPVTLTWLGCMAGREGGVKHYLPVRTSAYSPCPRVWSLKSSALGGGCGVSSPPWQRQSCTKHAQLMQHTLLSQLPGIALIRNKFNWNSESSDSLSTHGQEFNWAMSNLQPMPQSHVYKAVCSYLSSPKSSLFSIDSIISRFLWRLSLCLGVPLKNMSVWLMTMWRNIFL